MSWLITGGAGYIGAHVVRVMQESGYDVVILDDLSTGHRSFVPNSARFVEGSIASRDVVDEALRGVSGVIHLAGFKYAGVSVREPLRTYLDNVEGTRVLLAGMLDAGVHQLVFSSSAATFGTPAGEVVTEETATNPQSPYGESKLIGEWLIRDVERVTDLRATSLRYFNVVGSGWDDLPDTSPHNLFPRIIAALGKGEQPLVFGTDYDTPDGSCVRDYVHVHDLALAHVAAARALERGERLAPVYNLGSGSGTSVLEIMTAFQQSLGEEFVFEVRDRRPGDPSRIVATGELAGRDLGWQMRHDVASMAASAWKARGGADG